jgi:hypothetical protein
MTTMILLVVAVVPRPVRAAAALLPRGSGGGAVPMFMTMPVTVAAGVVLAAAAPSERLAVRPADAALSVPALSVRVVLQQAHPAVRVLGLYVAAVPTAAGAVAGRIIVATLLRVLLVLVTVVAAVVAAVVCVVALPTLLRPLLLLVLQRQLAQHGKHVVRQSLLAHGAATAAAVGAAAAAPVGAAARDAVLELCGLAQQRVAPHHRDHGAQRLPLLLLRAHDAPRSELHGAVGDVQRLPLRAEALQQRGGVHVHVLRGD